MQFSTVASRNRLGAGAARAKPRALNRTSVIVRADPESNGKVPLNVLEAREWIAEWKFSRVKVNGLPDAIRKAAGFLEDNKEVRKARYNARNRKENVQFHVRQKVQFGQSVRLVGGAKEFGAWDPNAAPATTWSDGDVWQVTIPLPVGNHEYKVVGLWEGGAAQWEEGDNRYVEVPTTGSVGVQYLDGRLPIEKH